MCVWIDNNFCPSALVDHQLYTKYNITYSSSSKFKVAQGDILSFRETHKKAVGPGVTTKGNTVLCFEPHHLVWNGTTQA